MMRVNGREINFKRTVAANCKIADLCPDMDIKNADKLFAGKYQDSQLTAAKVIAILNEGYEQNKKFSEPGYEPNPISVDELLSLDDDLFGELFTEAMEAYAGEKATVEVEPEKGKKNKSKDALN